LRGILVVVALLVVAGATPAFAYPLLAPRPIPDAMAGPADPHVAATFYNPAAIGYLRGVHFYVDGGARGHTGSINQAGGSSTIGWADLDSFVGLTWDLGTESITLGLAAYTPFTDFSSYAPSSPARFHERVMRFGTFEQTLAAAWQIERHVSIGAALLVGENWLDYSWSRDAAPAGGSATVSQPSALCGGMACGYGNPMAEQQLKLRGYATSIGFSVGIIVRPDDRVWLGTSYSSHQAGGDLVLTDNKRGRVNPAPGQGGVCGGGPCGGDDRVVMGLPEMVQAAMRVVATPRLDVEAQFRFVHYGARSTLDVSLQGGNLPSSGVPPQLLLDRGLQNTYAVEVSTRHLVTPNLRLSPSLMFETSAVAADAVSPAALDAPKLDAALAVEWRALRSGATALFVGAHLGATAYVLGNVSSRFDARAETACVDAGYSLAACAKQNAGDALPSASGDYSLFVVHAGASIGVVYQP
jgi:long-subunit fatty acid transport protein